MSEFTSPGAHLSNLEVAELLLEKIGVSADDLRRAPAMRPTIPTFGEYVPRVTQAASAGARRVYSPYWQRVVDAWGPRLLTDINALDIRDLAEYVKAHVVIRRNTRGGRGAVEHFIGAVRCVYRYAVADGLISESENPAARVSKPRRLPNTRRALPDALLGEINRVVATTGNDPVLDTLLVRLHLETACRRGGALALRPRDLDVEQCLVQLREKGETVRWQPVSPTLMTALVAHRDKRGNDDPDEQLLRYPNRRPITSRRYDHLWERLGKYLPWVAAQQVSTHWIRHTTLTWVERNFGYAVARAYAGHAEGSQDVGATATYVRATVHEVAAALAAMTGERHPLANAS
jgi:integrase/recombinase XerC